MKHDEVHVGSFATCTYFFSDLLTSNRLLLEQHILLRQHICIIADHFTCNSLICVIALRICRIADDFTCKSDIDLRDRTAK